MKERTRLISALGWVCSGLLGRAPSWHMCPVFLNPHRSITAIERAKVNAIPSGTTCGGHDSEFIMLHEHES